MNASLRTLAVLAVLLVTAAVLPAEEKNGLLVTVGKVTLDRADQRRGYYYSTRIDRTEGLKVSIRNTSFKPRPEGELEWQILVRKYYSSDIESSNGKEKLKPLRAAEATEMVIGGASVKGWRDGYDQSKDKLEWQVIIRHEGAETIKLQSTSGFDALAKRAAKS